MQTNFFNYQATKKHYLDCPVCGSANSEIIFASDRYNMGITTVICKKCGLIYTNPRPDDDVFYEFYEKHYREFYEDAEYPSDEYIREGRFTQRASIVYNYLKDFIEEGHSSAPVEVLDVGCSEGSVLRFILRNSNCKVAAVGIEPSKNFSRFAREYTGARIYNGTLEGYFQRNQDSKFDIIILNHVLEHFLEPGKSLSCLHGLLKDDGILFIEVPNILGKWSGIGMFHIAHVFQFYEASLKNLLAIAGFTPISVSTKGNEIHPWSMTFICKKDAESLPEYPSQPEIMTIKETIWAKLGQESPLPTGKGFLQRVKAWFR